MKTGNPRRDRTHRPPVLLTQPSIEDPTPRTLTPLERVYLNRVLTHHDHPLTDRLQYACLTCATIGEAADQAARDHNARHIDFTCCDPATTVLYSTQEV